MSRNRVSNFRRTLGVAFAASTLGGCAGGLPVQPFAETDERLCMARVMFFESLRSSDDGMLAVGTVVMNRLASGRYPNTVCGVIGQTHQFAPGALTLPFKGQGKDRALHVADRVLAGERHPGLEHVYFFHTAGYTFPYHNMHYVLVAGGNAFYYKTNDRAPSPNDLPGPPPGPQLAYAEPRANATAAQPRTASEALANAVPAVQQSDGERPLLLQGGPGGERSGPDFQSVY